MFIVEISTQKNYLFYKKTMIDVFTVSTGSKQDTREPRNEEGVWRLGQRMDKGLADIYGARLIYEKYSQKTKTISSNQ